MPETVLFLAHIENNGDLDGLARETLEVAKNIGGNLVLGLVGGRVPVAPPLGCRGIVRFLAVEGSDFAQARYATDAAAAEALYRASGASIIVAPQTSRWSRVLAGVAERVSGSIDTHVTGVAADGALLITRWYYRQRMEAVFDRVERPCFLLLEGGMASPQDGPSSDVKPEYVVPDISAAQLRTTVIGKQWLESEQQTIRPDSRLLLVAGAGWTKKQKDGRTHLDDATTLIRDFLDMSQASLGSSKSLTDLTEHGEPVLPFLSHLNQVGQTGSTPRHPKGLATCCHGEEPHVVGWRFIKERRAVNLDANCGWARGKADVLYVADAFEVIARVNAMLRERVPVAASGA